MTKMTKISYALGAVLLSCVCIASCEKVGQDDFDEKRYGKYVEVVPDELGALQKSLTKLDEDGNLVERYVGVSLEPADKDEVSVGVENLDEAKAIFASWFADTTRISANGTLATFSCGKGSAQLVPQTNERGQIAYVSFDMPGLKHISRINFILNSAWPDNASERGFHKLGVRYEYNCWTGYSTPAANDYFDRYEMLPFVCVREYKNGVPAMLVGIRKPPIFLYWRFSEEYGGNMPDWNQASEISSILRSNWETYKAYFNIDQDLLCDGEEYWYHGGLDAGVVVHRRVIILSTGEDDYYDVHYREPRRATLFFMYSGQKM